MTLQSRQLKKLLGLLGEIYPRNPFWRERLDAAAFQPGERYRRLEDLLDALPFTSKEEIEDDQRRHSPYGSNLTYPLSRYTRLHQTSGTTGAPLRWLDTPESWQWWKRCWRGVYEAAAVNPQDRIFYAFSFGPFIGFWSAFECALDMGNLCLAGGGMSSAARLRFLLENRATVVACTPTYALRLAEVAVAEGLDLPGSPVRALIVAGEPGGSVEPTRARIETAWGAHVFDHCGMTEVGAFGFECQENPGGMHVNEEEFIGEVVELGGTTRLAPGEAGELVITNLGRPGSPAIRYRTGDLVRWSAAACPCGRSWGRLDGGILGRADDMILVRGTNVYPSAIDALLRRFPEVAEYRVRIPESQPVADLHIELDPAPGVDGHGGRRLVQDVARAVQDALFLRPRVSVVPSGSLPRFEMKAQRFVRERGGADRGAAGESAPGPDAEEEAERKS